MQVFDAVKTLLAVRSYQDKPVEPEAIRRVVEAARLTASSVNRQEWDFIVITDRERLERLGELASTGGYIAEAAFAVAVTLGDYRSALADAGRAVQDMMLTAWEEGIGSNWVGNVATDEIHQFLGVPDDRKVVTIVPFGFPDKELGAGIKDRKAFDEVVHLDHYGNPFSD